MYTHTPYNTHTYIHLTYTYMHVHTYTHHTTHIHTSIHMQDEVQLCAGTNQPSRSLSIHYSPQRISHGILWHGNGWPVINIKIELARDKWCYHDSGETTVHVTSLTSTWILPSLLLAHVMVEQYHVYVGKYLPKYKRGRISNQKNVRVKKIKHNYTNTAHMTHFGRKDSADTDVVFTNRADQHTQEKPWSHDPYTGSHDPYTWSQDPYTFTGSHDSYMITLPIKYSLFCL